MAANRGPRHLAGSSLSLQARGGNGSGKLLDLPFQLTHAVKQLGQLLDGNNLALGLTVRGGGDAKDAAFIFDITHNAGLGSDHGLIANFQMVRNSRLRGDHDVITELGAAGETDLSHDQTMTANRDIVGDMDEVIDFCTLTNDGGAEGAAIDGRVRANLDVVVDDDVTDLKDFPMAALIEHVTKAVGANNGTGVDGDAMTDLRLAVKNDVREEADIIANPAVGTDIVAAHQNGTGTQMDAGAYDTIGSDVGGRIDLSGVGDDRTGMDAAGMLLRGEEEREQASEGDAGIGHTNEDFPGRDEWACDEDGSGLRLLSGSKIGRILRKSQFTRPGAIGRSQAGELDGGITNDLGVECFSDLSSGESHRMRGDRLSGWERFRRRRGIAAH